MRYEIVLTVLKSLRVISSLLFVPAGHYFPLRSAVFLLVSEMLFSVCDFQISSSSKHTQNIHCQNNYTNL